MSGMEVNKNFGYLPPKMYAFLVRFGEEYNLSVKEVQNTILRYGLESLGFKCEHLDIRAAKSNGKPYCHNCWTRMRLIKPGTFSIDRKVKQAPVYEALPTFMDDGNLWHNLHRDMNKENTITEEEKRGTLYNI